MEDIKTVSYTRSACKSNIKTSAKILYVAVIGISSSHSFRKRQKNTVCSSNRQSSAIHFAKGKKILYVTVIGISSAIHFAKGKTHS